MKKQNAEMMFTGFLLLISAIYLLFALKMPMGSAASPDSGFLPVLLGAIGVGISLFLLGKGIKLKNTEIFHEFIKANIFRVLGFAVVLFLFTVSFTTIGFWGIFPILFLLFKIMKYEGWFYPILFSALFTIFIYAIFVKFLSVPLPAGIFS